MHQQTACSSYKGDTSTIRDLAHIIYIATASLYKLTGSDNLESGEVKKFSAVFLVRKHLTLLGYSTQCFRKDNNKPLQLVLKPPIREAVSETLYQVIFAADNFRRHEQFSPVQIPTRSEEIHEDLKLAHRVVNVVSGTICTSKIMETFQVDRIKEALGKRKIPIEMN